MDIQFEEEGTQRERVLVDVLSQADIGMRNVC